jgi:hypothetical protein
MKTLRRILIILAAPAALLFGLSQLGGTPIYKGFNTGFDASAEAWPTPKLSLSTETGDLTCWLKLKMPASAQVVSANLSNSLPLGLYQESSDGINQWVAIVAAGQKPEEKFKWPSGTQILITFKNGSSLALSDWRLYLSDQAFDSKERAIWRSIAFVASIVCLVLAVLGGGLEAKANLKEEEVTFTHERCLEQMIRTVEGKTPQETEWMRVVLTKVVLQRIPPKDAIASLPLKPYLQRGLFLGASKQFRQRLEWLISELNKDLNNLLTS